MKSKEIILYGLSSIVATGSLKAEEKKQETAKPNVLFIIMDDMCDWARYLGGNNQVLTPNLDRLVARGVSFSNAYTGVPLSNPSRTSLLTGIPAYVSGVYTNDQEISTIPMINNSLMMPQHFHDNGYTTICSGKIFHTHPSGAVMAKMWDDTTNIDGGYGPFIKHQTLPQNLQQKWQNYEAWTGPDTDFPDIVNSQKIIDYLGQSHSKPFFAAMGFYRPHGPYTAPKRYFDLYNLNTIQRPFLLPVGEDLADVPQYAIDNFIGADERAYNVTLNSTGNCYEQLIRAYMASVSFADDRIGMILNALDASPYADNTVIVLIGDNGFHHGEKERWGKMALWREACHVPFAIIPAKNDTRIAKGTYSTPVSLMDLYPTLIDLCELPQIANQLAGNSLMPVLTNLETKWKNPSISTYLSGNFTVHADQWNFIKYANNSYELYNISNDENEITNLAYKAEYASIVDSLSTFLPKTWVANSDTVVNSVSEDLSTSEWGDEILRLNPTYVKPAIGTNFGISTTSKYFNQYVLNGAIVYIAGTPNCIQTETTHGNSTEARAFRIAKNSSSILEFPIVRSASKLTMHVRNGNATTATKLYLDKFDSGGESYSTVDSAVVRGSSSYSGTSIDEIISFNINSPVQVKLRIHGGSTFVNVFKVVIDLYGITDNQIPTMNNIPFKLNGRKLTLEKSSKITIYSILGIPLFEKVIQSDVELPGYLGRGVFVLKIGTTSQKILL